MSTPPAAPPRISPPHHRFLANCRLFYSHVREALRLVPVRYKLRLAMATLIIAATSAAGIVVALMLGKLLDGIKLGLDGMKSGGDDKTHKHEMFVSAAWILLVLAAVYVARELLNVVRRHLVDGSCTAISCHMQNKVVEHVLKTNLGDLAREKTGVLHGKMLRSVEGLVRFIKLVCLDCLPALFTGVFALTTAICKAPLLGAVMVGVVPLSAWLTFRQLSSQKGVRMELMRDGEEIDGTVVEQLGGMEYIRAADTLPLEMARLSLATGKRRKKEVRHHFQMSLYGCAKALNEGLFHILVLALATYLAINGELRFGDVLAFSLLFLSVMAPLNEIHRVVDEGHESSMRVAEFLELMRLPIDPSFGPPPAAVVLELGRPIIEIDNLRLDYLTPDGKPKRGLDGISLTIHHGQTIGVAGPSGSGKSTLIKALLRLTHPSAGEFRVGGAALHTLGRKQLAELIAYVGQAPFVFSGSVRENIAYGNGILTEGEIVRAAEMAHLQREIFEMPHGFSTQILERGQNVSGGQRQRLAIARILIKDSPILILDEATSALDNISESRVQEALGIRRGDRTTLIIAHRLSTLKDCDRILVFDAGKIVESGTYAELLEKQGLFANLVASGTRSPE